MQGFLCGGRARRGVRKGLLARDTTARTKHRHILKRFAISLGHFTKKTLRLLVKLSLMARISFKLSLQ